MSKPWYRLRVTRREYSLLELSQYAALAIVALITLLDLPWAGWRWWVAAGLLVALGVLYRRWPQRSYHLYLAAQTALIVGLTLLDAVAVLLSLAEGTVKNYVTGVLQKMGVRDRTQAALRARELGLV